MVWDSWTNRDVGWWVVDRSRNRSGSKIESTSIEYKKNVDIFSCVELVDEWGRFQVRDWSPGRGEGQEGASKPGDQGGRPGKVKKQKLNLASISNKSSNGNAQVKHYPVNETESCSQTGKCPEQ